MSEKKDRWVVSRDVSWSGEKERHIVRQGAITTACGATASMPDVWRHSRSKKRPKCLACLAKAPDPEGVK